MRMFFLAAAYTAPTTLRSTLPSTRMSIEPDVNISVRVPSCSALVLFVVIACTRRTGLGSAELDPFFSFVKGMGMEAALLDDR